ncbi:lck-interacting transmembrane adapter 1 isoform X5 [Chionomys nivalis]|uniref:lck-interacting transmembrane adapter 1 isoform X5 n=1 Tax=Chionomys nivalis TaxID=269649 RepID=UPI002598EA9D|nr:lck-interacting transmembrane adapter 1 isoform X5 [Chionomys nivalis]
MQSLGVSGVLSQPGRKNPPAGRGLQWSCRCWSLRQPPELISPVPRSPFPALEDEAISAFSPTSPLGLGVLLPAPLAVGTVHSLPQVCAWGCVCPLHVWLCMCVYTGPGPGPSSAHWTNGTLAPRKRAQRQQTGLQGSLIPVEMSLLRQAHVRSLSKSDTRLHELRPGLRCSIAPRPASMDLLHPHWLEVSRGSTRSQGQPGCQPCGVGWNTADH